MLVEFDPAHIPTLFGIAGMEIRTSLVQDTVDCFAAAVPPGTRLIVFGSMARGDARDDSDIDLIDPGRR